MTREITYEFEELELVPGTTALCSGRATIKYDREGHVVTGVDLLTADMQGYVQAEFSVAMLIMDALRTRRQLNHIVDAINDDIANRRLSA